MQRWIFSLILSLVLLTVGASAVPDIPMVINGNVFLQAVTSPPPIPNTFSGKVKIINLSGEFNAAEGTLIEASIDGIIKGSTTATKEGSYIIDVRGDHSDDGKKIIFRVDGRSDTSSFFSSSNPPPRSLDIEIMESIPPVSVCNQDKLKCENVGTPVKFNGSESYDPDGSIVNYEWEFGDGTMGSGTAPDHKYASYRWNGTTYQPFIVNLTVTDNNGLMNTSSNKVVIWIAGDANGDGKVNILDASVVGLKWGGIEPCADLNNDVKVNILDASIIGLNWGKKAIV